jgi:hypothetical protein
MFLRKLLKRVHHEQRHGESLDAEAIGSLIEQLQEETEADVYRRLKRGGPVAVWWERRVRAGFERRLKRRWRRAIYLYDLAALSARRSGEKFNREHREQAVVEQDLVFEALVRIHARACMIASEVRALMVSGHSSGALARWRSLHELAVVAFFVKEHGREVAERYILHEVIRTEREASKYERYHKKLGYEPPDPDELAALRKAKDALVARFGPEFAGDWGWAAGVLKGKPKFAQIEAAAGLDHWRPHFGMASHSVHAGYKGMTFDVGYSGRAGYSAVMFAGATNAGLADPGHSAIISLMQCTTALLIYKPDFDGLAELRALQRLTDDVGEAFIEARRQLEQDEARFWPQDRDQARVSG